MFLRVLLTVASLFLAVQAHASAFDSLNDQKLQGDAYDLLKSQSENVRLVGDVHADEKLSAILAQVDDYEREMLEVLQNGGDIEKDMKSSIRLVDNECKVTGARATCDLTITYRPIGETTVRFTVTLDETQKPVAVDGIAEVFRGH